MNLGRFTKKLFVFFIFLGFYSVNVVHLSPAQDRSQIWGLKGSQKGLQYEMQQMMTRDRAAAIFKKYLKVKRYRLSKIKREKLAERLATKLIVLSGKHRFSPAFLLSVIQAESNFQVDARSRVGAAGLMQVMPRTARYIARKWNIKRYRDSGSLYDPLINMELGVTYLAFLRDKYNGDARVFLTAYNAGPTLVDRFLKQERSLSTIRESHKYVRSINGHVEKYSALADAS